MKLERMEVGNSTLTTKMMSDEQSNPKPSSGEQLDPLIIDVAIGLMAFFARRLIATAVWYLVYQLFVGRIITRALVRLPSRSQEHNDRSEVSEPWRWQKHTNFSDRCKPNYLTLAIRPTVSPEACPDQEFLFASRAYSLSSRIGSPPLDTTGISRSATLWKSSAAQQFASFGSLMTSFWKYRIHASTQASIKKSLYARRLWRADTSCSKLACLLVICTTFASPATAATTNAAAAQPPSGNSSHARRFLMESLHSNVAIAFGLTVATCSLLWPIFASRPGVNKSVRSALADIPSRVALTGLTLSTLGFTITHCAHLRAAHKGYVESKGKIERRRHWGELRPQDKYVLKVSTLVLVDFCVLLGKEAGNLTPHSTLVFIPVFCGTSVLVFALLKVRVESDASLGDV